MPRLRVILEEDNGSPLPDTDAQVSVLENECDTLNQIDEAVERPLLSLSQQRFTTQEQKTVPAT